MRGIYKTIKGFTLVETLLATGVGAIIGIILLSILVNHTGVFYKQNALVSEGLSLNDTVSLLNSQIRQGVAVVAGYPEVGPTLVTSENTLVFKLPAYSADGIISEVFDFIAVYHDPTLPNVLRMQVFPDPASSRPASNIVLTSLLQSVRFDYLNRSGVAVTPTNASSVEVEVTVISKTGSIGSSRSVKTISDLRNH